MFPFGEFDLKRLVLFRELIHFPSQPLVLESCVPFSSRMGRSGSHCRLAVCH